MSEEKDNSVEDEAVIVAGLTNEEFIQAQLDFHELNALVTAEMLSPASRAERDRLLVVGITALLSATVAKITPSLGLSPFALSVSDARAIPIGLAVVLAYFVVSFGLMAWLDWERWHSNQAPATNKLGLWNQKLFEMMAGLNMQRREHGDDEEITRKIDDANKDVMLLTEMAGNKSDRWRRIGPINFFFLVAVPLAFGVVADAMLWRAVFGLWGAKPL